MKDVCMLTIGKELVLGWHRSKDPIPQRIQDLGEDPRPTHLEEH